MLPLFCVVAGTSSAGAQLTSDRLEVTIAPSAVNRTLASFTVHNAGKAAAQAMITREDWDRLENGENRFVPSGTTGNSCGALMSVLPLSFRIEAGADQIVRVAVEKVSGTPKECWDIIFVQNIPQKASLTRSGLRYVFRTGVKVYVGPAELSRSAEITAFSTEESAVSATTGAKNPATKSSQRVVMTFHNNGDRHLLANGRIEFRTLDNRTAAQVSIPEFPTLPGATRRLVVDTPASLPPGRYIALALLDYHGAETLAAQLELSIK